MKLPLAGGCVCGAIRYEVSQAPLQVYACHCTDCQRMTSSAFSIGVVVPEAGFHATGREPRIAPGGVAASGRVKQPLICPDCGTWLFGKPRPGAPYPGPIRIIRGGTLDDTSWLRPASHFWIRSKQAWLILPDGAVLFDTQPDRG